MTRGAHRTGGRHPSPLALALLILALAFRIAIPAGWMPSTGKGFAITICTGTGMVQAWVDASGETHRTPPHDGHAVDQPCAFAGMAAALDIPPLPTLAAPPAVIAITLATPRLVATIGQGLAAPPPPATGPPLPR